MQASAFSTIGVVGAGAWGTALAQLCAGNDADVLLWAREPEVARSVNEARENTIFLSGVTLHERIRATPTLGDLVRCEAIIFVAPAQFARPVMAALGSACDAGRPVLLCSKGIEQASGLLMTELLAAVWPDARPGVLSGPSFAADVARGLPTAVTLAVADPDDAARWAASLAAPHFRPYLTDDLAGAELGGAIKNVLAIAAGVVEGRGLGQSARAAVIARGYAEFKRLGLTRGAREETMTGLAGLGDLILTATSSQSRNMSLGQALGRGARARDILGTRQTVSEGAATADAVVAMAERAGIEMPICQAVADLVADRRDLDTIIDALMTRPLRPEGA